MIRHPMTTEAAQASLARLEALLKAWHGRSRPIAEIISFPGRYVSPPCDTEARP